MISLGIGGNKFSSNATKKTAGYPNSAIQEDTAVVTPSNMLPFSKFIRREGDIKVRKQETNTIRIAISTILKNLGICYTKDRML
jgi:hypothetical protein